MSGPAGCSGCGGDGRIGGGTVHSGVGVRGTQMGLAMSGSGSVFGLGCGGEARFRSSVLIVSWSDWTSSRRLRIDETLMSVMIAIIANRTKRNSTAHPQVQKIVAIVYE